MKFLKKMKEIENGYFGVDEKNRFIYLKELKEESWETVICKFEFAFENNEQTEEPLY